MDFKSVGKSYDDDEKSTKMAPIPFTFFALMEFSKAVKDQQQYTQPRP
jgi:hypothetical protein